MNAGIGHNRPPTLAEQLAIDYGGITKDAHEAVANVPMVLAPITSDEEAAAVTEQASEIKSLIDEANGYHKTAKEPWLDGSRTVDGFFSFRAMLTAAAGRLRDAIGKWQTEQRNAALKAKAEAEAKEREMAEAFDMPEPVAPVRQGPPVAVAPIVSAGGAKASGSVKWEYEEIDAALIPREFLKVNEAAVRAKIAGMKAMGTKIADAKIPGLRIYETVKASIR